MQMKYVLFCNIFQLPFLYFEIDSATAKIAPLAIPCTFIKACNIRALIFQHTLIF